MHKHLKSELVPPDHVNPKLSAGISEVIEMMMSKRVKSRYPNCTDLLVDLRALKNGETPPIAHKDVLPENELASLAAAEAAAVVEIPQDESRSKRGSPAWTDHISWPPFLVLVVILVISVAMNIIGLG
jgi:eukaryotic-like serine/threonine-protein kinase